MNPLKLLAGIEATLRRLLSWDGWTDQDRTLITDIHRQIGHLERRRAQREVALQRGGR